MSNFIVYNHQGATRNRPLNDDLVKRLQFLQHMGITMQVFSGGQPGKDEGGARVGSVRHDHGGAADAFFYKDGRRLDWSNPDDLPLFQQIVSQGKANGITGFGAGPGYMQQGSMHIGMGAPGVWGAGGSSENAPEWLRAAYGARADPAADVVAAADPNAFKGLSVTPAAAPVEPVAPVAAGTMIANPEAGKPYHDGFISWIANHFGSGADKQPAMVAADAKGKPTDATRSFGEKIGLGKGPDSILGVKTSKAVDTFGALSKMIEAQTAAQNQQAQATAQSAQARRGQAQPVEIEAAPSSVLQPSAMGQGGLIGTNLDDEIKKKRLFALLGMAGMGGKIG